MFDLDGTLVDSKDAIVDSAMRILKLYNFEGLAESDIRKSIGLPVEVVFGKVIKGDALISVTKAFREDLLLRGSGKTTLYSGVEKFLASHSDKNTIKVVVTNKPKELATYVLKELGVLKHFKLIVGPDITLAPKPSPSIIQHVLRIFPNCSRALMVGDRKEDIEAARAAGVTSVLMIHPDHDFYISAESKPDYTSYGFKNLETLIQLGENDNGNR